METSPPVRDVSERERANRNKCIIVAVISVLVLTAVVLVIGYITHFRSTELTPTAADALVDKSILGIKEDAVHVCDGKYVVILKENDTALIERLGDCVAIKDEDDESDDKNSTEPAVVTNILCKLSAANVKILPAPNSTVPPLSKECKFNVTIDLDFDFDDDRNIEDIRLASSKTLNGYVVLGVVDTVNKVLGQTLLELASGYTATNATIEPVTVNWSDICRRIPSEC